VYSRLEKKDKSDKNSSFENVYCSYNPDLQIFSFLLRLKYNEFGSEFLHISRSDYDLHLEFSFRIFLKLLNLVFEIFKKKKSSIKLGCLSKFYDAA
jgi:hypothetical protein